jgi:peptide/nickel transport system permease protein
MIATSPARQAENSSDASAGRPVIRSQSRLAWQRFKRHQLAAVGAGVFLVVCLATLAAPLSPYDPDQTHLLERFAPPSLAHPMGTDDLGRDEVTRILFGGRISLAVGMLATLVAVSLGTLVGAFAGYFGGWVDSVLMRVTEALIAFPPLFVLILLATLVGSSLWTIVLVVGLLRWMVVARLMRATYLQLKEREFVTAARSVGVTDMLLMRRHILPNTLGALIVVATLHVAGAILAESTLSFLGLGIQLPTPSWGNMLRSAQGSVTLAPWLAVFPGAFIFISILSINYVGDGLRDALDPRHA